MDHKSLQAAWIAKNQRIRKPIAVPIDGVGTVFVRPIMMDEANYVDELVKSNETGTESLLMAWLLCNEDGSRITEGERKEWQDIFATASRADYNALITAARGVDAGN